MYKQNKAEQFNFMPIHRPLEATSGNPELNLPRPDAPDPSLSRADRRARSTPGRARGIRRDRPEAGDDQARHSLTRPAFRQHLPTGGGAALRDSRPRSGPRAGQAGRRPARTDLTARLIVPLRGSRVQQTHLSPRTAPPLRVRTATTPRSCPWRRHSSHAPTIPTTDWL